MTEPSIELDHLVLATDDLEQGARYLQDKFGIRPDAGGRHIGYGTHNCLLNLGSGTYLELIAPDPDQPAPAEPRPFGLDNPAQRERMAVRPRLVNYMVRTNDISATTKLLGYELGAPRKMSRGDLNWQLSLSETEQSPSIRLLPSVINWAGQQPPGQTLPLRGVVLTALHLRGPGSICRQLEPLTRDRRVRIAERVSAMLAAEFQTPNGWVILD